MKDMRPGREVHGLTRLAEGDGSEASARLGESARHTRLWPRFAALVLAVVVLAVVIGPHLIDGTRISSVVDEAARDAGGVEGVLPATCPPLRQLALGAAAVPVAILTSAVVCHYPAARTETPPAQGRIPASQLAILRRDLVANTAEDGQLAQPDVVLPSEQPEAWAVLGKTSAGDQIALVSLRSPSAYVWSGTPARVWRPSVAVRQMLADDLPR